MSDTDSFIDEVTEEVRRDRMFFMLKRYGWIAVLAILAIVGGASWREYSKAQDRSAAQALGDGILAGAGTGRRIGAGRGSGRNRGRSRRQSGQCLG